MRRYELLTCAVVGLAASLSANAADPEDQPAQPNQPAATNSGSDAGGSQDLQEVIVTGTLIRGVAPTGTNVVALSSADIQATGASNANQILAHVPEVTTAFNATPTPGSGPLATIARPDIRRLNGSVGAFGAGGNATLVLIDGHRVVGAGTTFETPDPDIVPTAILDRVEVVPDGGSSIYGSDAIGGVINFITKKKFDGAQVSLRGGGASDFHTIDTSITGGTSWDTGSVFASYTFVNHNAIYGRDRDYVRSPLAQSGACFPGTVSVTRNGIVTNYALPNFTPNSSTSCDVSDGSTIYPAERRHSFFAGLSEDLGSSLHFEVRGLYTDRSFITAEDPNARNFIEVGQAITPANPFYTPVPNDTGSQNVSFSFAGVADPHGATKITEWGVTPTLTWDIGGAWQARLMGNYGQSKTTAYELAINAGPEAAAMSGTTTATALDPYDVTLTNPGVLSNILARNYQESTEDMLDHRLIVDGSALELPGGPVKLAVGGEVMHVKIDRGSAATLTEAQYSINDYSSLLRSTSTRTVSSAFGELSVPIFGTGNAKTGLQSLMLSASGRYDHYSDFGSTTNPKVGLTYKPIDSLTLRGNYGTSFTAPALIDMTSVGSLMNVLPFSPFLAPNAPPGSAGRPTIFVLGGNPNLQPQTATTYSFGGDLRPISTQNLTLSATYYNVFFKKQIAFVNFQSPDLYSPYYGSYVVLNPSQTQVQAIANQVQVFAGAPSVGSLFSGAATPYVMIDTRKQNLGEVKVDGLDFNANFVIPTGFGSFNTSAAGTYTLSRKFAPAAGAGFIDQIQTPGFSRLSFIGSGGLTFGKLSASLTWNYSSGYDINPASVYDGGGFIPPGTQTHVGSFSTVDAFVSYDISGPELLKDLQLTLTVNNLLDASPPFYGAADAGFTNGSTLGRLIQAGFTMKF